MAKTKVVINLDSDLVQKIDAEGKQMGLNRTATISMMIGTYFRQNEAIKAIANVTELSKNSEQ